ncbi:MAG: hypothetical protein ACTSRZ_14410 [Promethearchaeota archaeon]
MKFSSYNISNCKMTNPTKTNRSSKLLKNKHYFIIISFILLCSSIFLILNAPNYENKQYTQGKTNNSENNYTNNLSHNELSSSQINENDQLNSIGNNLTSIEFAQSTNSSINLGPFDSNQYALSYIDQPPGWTAYKLFSDISHLSDNITWQKNGNIDNSSNWNYEETDYSGIDANGTNQNENCWGYYAGPSVRPAGTDTGALFLHNEYHAVELMHADEYCAYNQTIYLDRANITGVKFSAWIYTQSDDAGFAQLYIDINGYKKTYSEFETGATHNTWILREFTIPANEIANYFSTPNSIYIEFGIDVTIQATLSGGDIYNSVYFDNITLWVRGEAKPSQIQLELNGTSIQDIDYGKGNLTLNGDWDNPSVDFVPLISNFTTGNSTGVQFLIDQTIFVNKTKYSQTSTGDDGTEFIVSNATKANWTAYYYVYIPINYEKYNFTLYYPTDWVPWSVYDPTPSEVLNYCNIGNGYLSVPSNRANDFPGLWKIEFSSWNYLLNMKLYKNTTATPGPNIADWVETNSIYAGDWLNITAYINNTGVVSNLDQTKAKLQIKFPNGTIWSKNIQLKNSTPEGIVYFDPIQIPANNSDGDYVVGIYKIFVSWNNSLASNSDPNMHYFNQIGFMHKNIMIKHYSKLTPDQTYYTDVLEETSVIVKISFNDKYNGIAIENALVYFQNLTGQTQYMSEISPGYYFAEIYAPNSNKGNNTITIYANHSHYQNISTQIVVEVVLKTNLTSPDAPSVSCFWNENATVTLNFTEETSKNPILNANITTNWVGDYWVNETGGGIYILFLNSSQYAPGSINQIIITIEDYAYQKATLIMDIIVSYRDADLYLFLNSENRTIEKFIQIEQQFNVNISVDYYDVLNDSTILNASVTLSGQGLNDVPLSFQNGYYQYLLDTSSLNIGSHEFTISATSSTNEQIIFVFTIIVNKRSSGIDLFLNQQNKTIEKAITLEWGQNLNVSIDYFDYYTSITLLSATVNMTGANPPNVALLFSNGLYQYQLNTYAMDVGSYPITIIAEHENYTQQTILFTLNIIQRSSKLDLFLNQQNKTLEKNIEAQINNLVNISIAYYDLNGSNVLNAFVNLTGVGPNPITLSFANNLYQYQLNTLDLGVGIHSLDILAKEHYHKQLTIHFTINVVLRDTDISLFLNQQNKTLQKSIEIPINSILNISIDYFEVPGSSTIVGAIVNLTREGQNPISMSYSNGLYQYMLDTSTLNTGIYTYSVVAQADDYKQTSILFTITINPRDTIIELYLNSQNKTIERSIEVQVQSIVNISVDYIDILSNMTITPATVNLTGACPSDITLSYSNGLYQCQLNTSDLGVGIFSFTIKANSTVYKQSVIYFTITVHLRDADIHLFLNSQNKTIERSIQTQLNDTINISIYFFDIGYNKIIFPATVNLTGVGSGEISLNYANGIYQYQLDSLLLGEGIHPLTITANESEHNEISIYFTITITPRVTGLDLLLNQENKTLIRSYTTQIFEVINISVDYYDLALGSINPATVNLTGVGSQDIAMPFNATSGYYQYLLNTSKLGIGVHFLTITAEKSGYIQQAIYFTITIELKPTELELYLNSQNKTLTRSIEVHIGDLVNISANYYMIPSKISITNAIVNISESTLGTFSLIQNNGIYQYLLNSEDLGIGLFTISLFALKENYTQQSLTFTIKILPKETDYYLYLNNENKTIIPQIEIPINSIINISIDYFEVQNHQTLIDSILNITDLESAPIIMPFKNGLYQYQFNTSILRLGTHFINIIAQKENYVQKAILISIHVTQIPTNITTASFNNTITVIKGKTFSLDIMLFDLTTNKLIKGADVSFTYKFGKGTLTDPDNDGHYTVNLTILEPDTYKIYITAYKGINYNFEPYEVIVSVIIPPEEGKIPAWIILMLIGIIIAIISLFISYELYFKYPKDVRIIKKVKRAIKRNIPAEFDIDQSQKRFYDEYLNFIKNSLPRKTIKNVENHLKREPEELGITVATKEQTLTKVEDEKSIFKEELDEATLDALDQTDLPKKKLKNTLDQQLEEKLKQLQSIPIKSVSEKEKLLFKKELDAKTKIELERLSKIEKPEQFKRFQEFQKQITDRKPKSSADLPSIKKLPEKEDKTKLKRINLPKFIKKSKKSTKKSSNF